MTPPPTSAWSRHQPKFLMANIVLQILSLHSFLFFMNTMLETTNELYLHSLLLLNLPGLIGSFQNLKQYQRWYSFYIICKGFRYEGHWLFFFILAVTTIILNHALTVTASTTKFWLSLVPRDVNHIVFDMLIFISMEGIFQNHLRVITGGVSVPQIVYYSSWVSNSRLDAYLATCQVEDSVNDNEDESERDTAPAKTTTTIVTTSKTTTAMTLKTKLTYLLVTIVLLLNFYREISKKVRVNFCVHNPLAYETYFDTSLNMNVISIKPQYQSYCYPPESTFETAFFHYLPLLRRGFSSFRVILAHLSGLLVALAWSAIPTDVITTAWTQMWNSPSSYLRKIHYILFVLPINFLVSALIIRFTPGNDFSLTLHSLLETSTVQAQYQMYWFLVFRTATKFAFGLGLIWNLYVAHSNRDGRTTDHLEEMKETAKESKNEV
ncbi:hypothetical protein BGZ96_009260 [Linnemannia gamsii]|uniref:Uncharacterized protein n=1 Tax=Linnemannia gamsii TaxID=64522 RepID=A0ABQ7JWQ9_9FUNG|nr:hypothetical protein BGZ96_009260 [Linnemannia gamsii]